MTSIPPNKMADTDMLFRQRAVIEFLVKEEIPVAEIHQRLQRAYGSVCMGASSVLRWVKHFKDGNTIIHGSVVSVNTVFFPSFQLPCELFSYFMSLNSSMGT